MAQGIVRGAEYLVQDQWVADRAAFRYTSCPESVISPTLNIQVLEGIAYAQRLSGSERLREVVVRGIQRALPSLAGDAGAPGLGKTISMVLRSAPFILFDLVRLEERF